MYISDAAELARFCTRASQARVVSVDTEFIRERSYYPELCLIQLGTASECVSIDPILIDDLRPLEALLANERITKVLHACSQDLEVIQNAMGCVVSPVFDTQLAAAFLGLRQQIGYGALVETYTGVHLPKAESLTDWSRRPLNPEQLRYAEDDVRYLPGIYDSMMAQLTEKDRLSWVRPEMDELTDPTRFAHVPERAYLHLKRASSLTRKQLACAREVCAWRERLAAKRDIPRRWVISDEILLEVCKRTPHSVKRLRAIRGIANIGERDAEDIVKAVARGAACDPADYPKKTHHERPPQEMEGVLDLMYAMLRVVSEKSGVAPQLIATKDDLLDFASGRRESKLRTSTWRFDLVGRQLEELLSGKVGLTVVNGHIELL